MRKITDSLASILVAVMLLAACGSTDEGAGNTDGDNDGDNEAEADGDDSPDGDGADGDTADGDNVIEQPTLIGRVSVNAFAWGGVPSSDANVSIEFYTGLVRMDAFAAFPPELHHVAARGGDCVLYLGNDSACNPPCDWDEYCDAENTCQDAPIRQSAGKVTLTAGDQEVSADPGAAGDYYSDPLSADLIAPDTAFAVEAAGDDFPGFSLQTTGVEPAAFDIDLQSNSITLTDGQDNEVAWEPIENGGLVQMILNSGWHGAPPEATMYCEAPASRGRLVIPQAVVEGFPSTGGIGLEPHMSYIGVARRVRASLPGGEVEFSVGWRYGIYPRHNAEGGIE